MKALGVGSYIMCQIEVKHRAKIWTNSGLEKEELLLYYDGETIAGKVDVNLKKGNVKKVDHKVKQFWKALTTELC